MGGMSALAFFVAGTPAPQGSKRHVGGGRLIESSKHVKPWREDVRAAAEHAMNSSAWTIGDQEPVTIDLQFWLRRPTSHPKRRRTLPVTKPDIDKLARSTLDALTSAGAISDDARVITITATKTYVHPDPLAHAGEPRHPGAHITITKGTTP